MLDFFYKFARKSVPPSLYEAFRRGRFGRRKSFETLGYYSRIFSEYQKAARISQPLENGANVFAGKTALEIGCGDQIFTALSMLAGGCKRVILADPKLDVFRDCGRAARSISEFSAETPGFSLTGGEVMERLDCYDGLETIPGDFNGGVDFIFSHTVLEHFDNLDIFFSSVRRLLAPDGISFNVVDLSDHTYHIFSKYRFTRWLASRGGLAHLRYSDKTFGYVNDPKCFMNRYLLPAYCRKASEYGFKCEITERDVFGKKVPVHKDLAGGLDTAGENDIFITGFKMLLR